MIHYRERERGIIIPLVAAAMPPTRFFPPLALLSASLAIKLSGAVNKPWYTTNIPATERYGRKFHARHCLQGLRRSSVSSQRSNKTSFQSSRYQTDDDMYNTSLWILKTRPGDEGDSQISYFRAFDERRDGQSVAQHAQHDYEAGHDSGEAPQTQRRPRKSDWIRPSVLIWKWIVSDDAASLSTSARDSKRRARANNQNNELGSTCVKLFGLGIE